jgi:hypothetical protein
LYVAVKLFPYDDHLKDLSLNFNEIKVKDKILENPVKEKAVETLFDQYRRLFKCKMTRDKILFREYLAINGLMFDLVINLNQLYHVKVTDSIHCFEIGVSVEKSELKSPLAK